MSRYTMDNVKQTQAYLLDESVRIHNLFRRSSTLSNLSKSPLLPLITVTTQDSTISPATINSSNRKQFLDLPDEFTNSLTPEIKVYKTYINQDGEEYTYLLPMGRYLEQDGITQGVVVKSAEFTRLGGNPAEVDTNISYFNLKLFAKDITTFFTKNEVMPMEPFTWTPPPNFAFNVARSEAAHNEIFDLEHAQQINQAQLNAPVLDARLTPLTPTELASLAESNADIRQRIDTNLALISRLNNRIDDLAKSTSDVAANGMRKVSWIDLIKINPGEELEFKVDNELVTSENQVRIKVEIGYVRPKTKPMKYNKGDWELWADVIEEQRETFYLSLFKHQFDFRGNDGIELSVDYIASGNAIQLSPRADLFDNPLKELRVKRLQKLMKDKEKELKAASEQEVQTEVTEQCMTALQDSIAEIDKKIRDIDSISKLRLLNQIYLQGDKPSEASSGVTVGRQTHYSRVYSRMFNTVSDDDKLTNRQFDPNYYFGDGNTLEGIQGRIGENTGTGRGIGSIQVVDQNFATDPDAAEESVTSVDMSSGQTVDMFIFLGDVVDAAIELLVPTDHATTHRLFVEINSTFVWDKEEREYDWTYHPPMGWQSRSDEGGARERCKFALTQFGGIVAGWVSYTNPNDIEKRMKIPIRDIPIALDIFRSWWINKFVKSGRNTLPLKDFIVELMKFVEKDVFKDIPIEYGTNTDNIDTPRFIINSSAVRGFAGIYDRIYGTGAGSSLISGMSNASELELADAFADSHEGGALFLTTIEQTNNNPKLQATTPTIVFGETSVGILKHISFEREDIPGHAEARLFSDRNSVAGNIALREKYNTKIDLVGTTTLLPGSLLYIDPLPLDLGYADVSGSLARSLGLGGMYRVVNLTSNINFDGSSNGWETTANTKWVSFSDGNNGISAATNPSSEALGLCASAEATAAAAAAADVPEEDEIQFDGDY